MFSMNKTGVKKLNLLLTVKSYALTELTSMSECKNREKHNLKITIRSTQRCMDNL